MIDQASGKKNGGRAGYDAGGSMYSPEEVDALMEWEAQGRKPAPVESPSGIAGLPMSPDMVLSGLGNLVNSLGLASNDTAEPSTQDPLRAQVTPKWLSANPLGPTLASTDASTMSGTGYSTLPAAIEGTAYSGLTDPDKLARLMLAEEPSDDPTALAAVGSTILNRVNSGMGGNNIAEVAQYPYQFEPMLNPDTRVISQNESSRYGNALAIANGLLTGEIGDPTGGATHFYSPTGQEALGRNTPSWAAGREGTPIGGHLFFSGVPGVGGFQESTSLPTGTGGYPSSGLPTEEVGPVSGLESLDEANATATRSMTGAPSEYVRTNGENDWINSPWLALAAGLLGAAATGSIGKGGMQGLQFLLQQRAAEGERQRLAEEAQQKQFGLDTDRMTAEARVKQLQESADIARREQGLSERQFEREGTAGKIIPGMVGANGFAVEQLPDGTRREVEGVKPATAAGAEKPPSLPTTYQKAEEDALSTLPQTVNTAQEASRLKGMLDTGELDLGAVSNMGYEARNRTGYSSPQSRAYADMMTTIEQLRNNILLLARGVQTEGDAQRALNAITMSTTDPKVMSDAIGKYLRLQSTLLDATAARLQWRRKEAGMEPIPMESLVPGYKAVASQIDPKAVGQELLGIAGTESNGPVRVTTKEEVDKLPSGSQFIGPDGKLRQKP